MSSCRIIYVIAFTFLMVISSSFVSASPQRRISKGILGFKAGLFGAGEFEIDGWKSDSKSGYSIGICLDYTLGREFMLGAAIDGHQIKMAWSGKTVDDGVLINFALSFKGDFVIDNSRLALRPSFKPGFAFHERIFGVPKTEYLTFIVSNEFVYSLAQRLGVLGELGLFWAPIGWGSGYDVSISRPVFFLRIGLVL